MEKQVRIQTAPENFAETIVQGVKIQHSPDSSE